MDAQKRTIVAFILVVLVLFLYQALVKTGKRVAPPSAERTETTPEVEWPAAKLPSEPMVPEIPAAEEKEVVVETDLLRAVITNLGVKSFQLKGYRGLGGGWIEEVEELKKLSKSRELDLLSKELKNGYKGMMGAELHEWMGRIEDLVAGVEKTYRGEKGEFEERVRKIGELPAWLEENYRGWVELVPYGARALSLDLPGADLGDSPFTITKYRLRDGERASIVYELPSGESLTEELSFENGSYQFKLKVTGEKSDNFRLNWDGGLAVTEQNKNDDLGYSAAVASLGGEFRKKNLLGLKKEGEGGWRGEGTVHWVGLKTKYFLACLIPEDSMKTEGFVAAFQPLASEPSAQEAGIGCMPGMGKTVEGRISLALKTRGRDLSVYVGPLDYDTLKGMGRGLEKVVDLGWGWISPISRGILALFKGIHSVVPNYGLVIIMFSCLVMVVFFPLTRRSLHQMQAMQKLQPKVEALRKKLKDEPQRMNVEMMRLYKEQRVNPLGGCLPLVFQMPVFFALFSVLRSTIELRRAGFLLWMDDLSVPDTLCHIPLPQGGEFALHTLPILMLVSMIVQQRFTPTDPRQKTMAYMMPIIFTFIFWNLPAGLVLYWLSYNVLSIAQHYLIRRRERERKEA